MLFWLKQSKLKIKDSYGLNRDVLFNVLLNPLPCNTVSEFGPLFLIFHFLIWETILFTLKCYEHFISIIQAPIGEGLLVINLLATVYILSRPRAVKLINLFLDRFLRPNISLIRLGSALWSEETGHFHSTIRRHGLGLNSYQPLWWQAPGSVGCANAVTNWGTEALINV